MQNRCTLIFNDCTSLRDPRKWLFRLHKTVDTASALDQSIHSPHTYSAKINLREKRNVFNVQSSINVGIQFSVFNDALLCKMRSTLCCLALLSFLWRPRFLHGTCVFFLFYCFVIASLRNAKICPYFVGNVLQHKANKQKN